MVLDARFVAAARAEGAGAKEESWVPVMLCTFIVPRWEPLGVLVVCFQLIDEDSKSVGQERAK